MDSTDTLATPTAAGDRVEVVVVGPTPPFRGGIAKYNSLLMRALGDRARCYSFKRQYPRILYPGKSDRDPAYSAEYREPRTRYVLDSINPFSWYRASREIASLVPRTVVFHWWTFFLAPCFAGLMLLLRRRNISFVVVVHNFSDHEGNFLKTALSKAFLGLGNAFLTHSEEHARLLRATYPQARLARRAIPVYDQESTPEGLMAKRGRLELLFFGFIRPYKGLDVLVEAIRMLGDESVHLTIVGETWGGGAAIADSCRGLSNIELHLHYVSDSDAAEFFARADFVVLPYKSASGSAVAALAFHFGKPVIASNVGGLADVVENGRNGILVPPSDARALSIVISGLDRQSASQLAKGAKDFKESNSWSNLAEEIINLGSTVR